MGQISLRMFVIVAVALTTINSSSGFQQDPYYEEKESEKVHESDARQLIINLKARLRWGTLPLIENCIDDLRKTAEDIHDFTNDDRTSKWRTSATGAAGAGLTFFPPTMLVGVGLMALSGIAGIGNMLVEGDHQKKLYLNVMERVEHRLQHSLPGVMEKFTDILEKIHVHGFDTNDDELVADIEEVKILYGVLYHVSVMWNSNVDEKTKKGWMKYMGSTAGSASSLSGLGIQSTILTGKALKAARAAAIKDALQAFKAARAAGDVSSTVSKATAIKNAVDGLNAARSMSSMASSALSAVGTGLSVVSFVWDSYELAADKPTQMEKDCNNRAQQLAKVMNHVKWFIVDPSYPSF